MVIRYDQPKNLLVVTKGHPFEKQAFFSMFDSMKGLTWTHVEQPAAIHLFDPDAAKDFAAFVLYDVPGIQFRTPKPPTFIEPPESLRNNLEELLERGQPFIFLHHAIAGWPTWDRYAEVMGGRFFYQPGHYKGRSYPDSGYMFPVTHRITPVVDHAVTAGLDGGFEIEDELYLMPALEDDILPLMRSNFKFARDNFCSAASALRARMWSRDGWEHPPGTDLVVWARRVRNSPIVYIQCGNDAKAYANAGFARLLRNAIDWVTSDEARAWVQLAQ
jgi:hypothetical protein